MVEENAGEFFAGLRNRIAEAMVKSESVEVRASLVGVCVDSSTGKVSMDRVTSRIYDDEELAAVMWDKVLSPEDAEPAASSLLESLIAEVQFYVERSKSIVEAENDGTVAGAKKALKGLRTFRGKNQDSVHPDFVEAMDREEERLSQWIEDVESWGDRRARQNFDYNNALQYAASTLELAGVPYSPVEAEAVVWHAGYWELQGRVNVLDPFTEYMD